MHVGLFGGSFNPPHLAHLILAELMRDQFALDRVWWIPAYRPPHKAGAAALAAPSHRLAMTQQAVAGNPAFDVSDVELKREGTSYTVDTLRTLQDAHPSHAFSLILGGDSFRDFRSWHRPEEILERVPLLVYRRPEEEALPGTVPAHRVRFAEAPLLQISSTEIRRRLHAGRSIRYFVPEAVRTYIARHGLYRE